MLDALRRHAAAPTSSPTLTYELPALVIFRLLGVPDEDVPRVKEWAASRVYLNFGDLPVEEQVEHARQPRALLALLPGARRVALRATRATTCPSDLARIYLEATDSLSIDEMAGLVYAQLTAGHETTTRAARRRPQGAADAARALGGASAPTPS